MDFVIVGEVKLAIKRGDVATVLASLAGGMNVNSQDGMTGMTLLARAVSLDQESIVKVLLDHAANVNIKDNTGNTPLLLACEKVRPETQANCIDDQHSCIVTENESNFYFLHKLFLYDIMCQCRK